MLHRTGTADDRCRWSRLHHKGGTTCRGYIFRTAHFVLGGTGENVSVRVVIIAITRRIGSLRRTGDLLTVAIPTVSDLTRAGGSIGTVDDRCLSTHTDGLLYSLNAARIESFAHIEGNHIGCIRLGTGDTVGRNRCRGNHPVSIGLVIRQ